MRTKFLGDQKSQGPKCVRGPTQLQPHLFTCMYGLCVVCDSHWQGLNWIQRQFKFFLFDVSFVCILAKASTIYSTAIRKRNQFLLHKNTVQESWQSDVWNWPEKKLFIRNKCIEIVIQNQRLKETKIATWRWFQKSVLKRKSDDMNDSLKI